MTRPVWYQGLEVAASSMVDVELAENMAVASAIASNTDGLRDLAALVDEAPDAETEITLFHDLASQQKLPTGELLLQEGESASDFDDLTTDEELYDLTRCYHGM